ncbi:DUF4136 domain-containing protein [Shewanella sp. D64]|uniref:DUF4136 domain-containing protein n=1 Tax=unclassified Shewanella TaxID=196818 RepID=UPI0022BA5956|nr:MULTISPECIES: DUF4136 domain-containing protein [unclassified Shewanella]MEC4726952.1 DUF4136 domain-containing protein [Shewanella sp. D64]MEC4738551.1 DUF4136 domain-containing protein [Shewanella sp. E94]WBJ93769.1 DUF4136 domain-containing protein [Shewanella sp. MTB7]
MIKQICALLLISTLSACTVSEVMVPTSHRTTMVATGDLGFLSPQTRDFAWHPTLAKVIADDRVDNDTVIKNMQFSLKKVMEAKGYRLVSNQYSPALLVGFGVALSSDMSDSEILNKAGLVPGLSTFGVDMEKYEKGSVLVALFNPKFPEPVWRALGQGFTDFEKDGAERQQGVNDFVSIMLISVPAI